MAKGASASIRDYIAQTFGVGEKNEEAPPVSKEDIIRRIGQSGTEVFSGYFQEEINQVWRDEQRVDIVEEMRRTDATVKAGLMAMKAPILATDFMVEGENDEHVEYVEQALFQMRNRSWKAFLREALTNLDFGYSVFEMIFELDGGNPVMVDLEPRIQNSIQSFPMINGERYVEQLIINDESEDVDKPTLIPASKVLLLTNDKEGDDVTGQSILRPAYKAYKIKDVLDRVSSISAERYGVGVPVVRMPDQFSEDDRNEAIAMVQSLKSNERSYIVLPGSGYQLEILTPQGNPQGQMIMDLIKHHDRQILQSMVANFLDLGSGATGSFALSKDQSSFFKQVIEDKIAYLEEEINRQVIERIIILRYGPQEEYPVLTHAPLGDTDLAQFSTALKTLVDSGVVIVNDKVRTYAHDVMQLPELTEEDIAEAQQERQMNMDREMEMAKLKAKMVDEQNNDDEEKDEEDVEDEQELVELLAEDGKQIKRELTDQEKRVNIRFLEESFDSLEAQLEAQMIEQIRADLEKNLTKLQKKYDAGDIAAIGALTLISAPAIKKLLKSIMKQAFDSGKQTASGELDVQVPNNSAVVNQVIDFEARRISDEFVQSVDREAKNKAIDGFQKGVTTSLAIAAIAEAARNKSSRMTVNLTGTMVGESINKGRRFLFDQYATRIKAYQRSEVLDQKTCNVCLSLDKRVVRADDPFIKLDLVHSHCRGFWVPVFTDEVMPTKNVGLPKTVTNAFDTLGGVPTVNSFTQLKKPLNKSNEEVQEEIKRRLAKSDE